jgi:hypothetical protein
MVVLERAQRGDPRRRWPWVDCREPLPGLHERYVSARWRQVLGSTMHCVAGDGIGILVGGVIGSAIALPMLADVGIEYLLGFGFGWTIFQALFMRDMFGSYPASLKGTFRSELLSMNCLMGGMIPVSMLARAGHAGSPRSDVSAVLVAHVAGADDGLHRRLSDELVAGGKQPETRHDDGAPKGRRRRPGCPRQHGERDNAVHRRHDPGVDRGARRRAADDLGPWRVVRLGRP